MANEFKVKKGLIVDGTNTVLDIQGTQGQLFSVTDSLTGDLFSVSDVSGVPILNVNSSGLVTVDGNLNLGDNDKIQFGASQDLQIYHNGSDSYIKDAGVGDLRIVASKTRFYDADLSHLQAEFTDGGSVDLYHSGNKKFETTSTGVTITGVVTATGGNSTQWNTAYGWGDHGLSAQDKTDIGNLSGTNTGDETKARINALDITELGTISSGVWQGSAISQTYLTGQSGTNTGDQTLPTIASLGAVTISTAQTITGAKTFNNAGNYHNGHLYYNAYDAAGNHYPHFLDGGDAGGTTINWRQYYGTSHKVHTWTSDTNGNMVFTYNGNIFGSNLSGTNTGDQTLPTDFVSAANGGTFSGEVKFDDTLKWATTNSTSYTYSNADANGLYIETAGSTAALSDMRFQARSAGSGNYSYIKIKPSDQSILLGTNAATRLTINSSGNASFTGDVQIGTSTNKKQLTVYGGNDDGIWLDSQGGRYTSVAWGNNGTEKANVAWDNTNTNFALTAYGSGSSMTMSTGGSTTLTLNNSSQAIFAGSASFHTTQAPIAKIQANASTFTGANGVHANSRVGIMNNGSLTSIVNASTYNDPTYPDYGLVFIQGPSTSSYNVWSISPDGPAKGSDLNFIHKANTTNIHTQPSVFTLHGSTSSATLAGDFNIDSSSASGSTVLDVQGTAGQLFSVTNSLTGDLFSVSDVSGIPIFNVNSSGASTFDGTIESSGNITCHKDAPKIILKDTGTGNAMTSEFSFHDGNGVSRGYVGYGSSGNSTMYWQNTLGDLQFHTSSALNLTLSGSKATFVGNVTLSGLASATQYLKQESTGELKIQTTHGYFQAGPANASYCHLTTDRARFYMNKKLIVDEGIFASYDEDLKLYRADTSAHSMTLSTTAATFTHDVVAYSDKKLKENIQTLDGSKVLKMRGVSFDRIDTGLPSSGVIAQEMQKVAPELVSETNGTLGVSYGNITGYLIEAIKDLKAEIEELKKQIK